MDDFPPWVWIRNNNSWTVFPNDFSWKSRLQGKKVTKITSKKTPKKSPLSRAINLKIAGNSRIFSWKSFEWKILVFFWAKIVGFSHFSGKFPKITDFRALVTCHEQQKIVTGTMPKIAEFVINHEIWEHWTLVCGLGCLTLCPRATLARGSLSKILGDKIFLRHPISEQY